MGRPPKQNDNKEPSPPPQSITYLPRVREVIKGVLNRKMLNDRTLASYAEKLNQAYYLRLPPVYEAMYAEAMSGNVRAAKLLIDRFDPDVKVEVGAKGGPDSAVARRLVELLKEIRRKGVGVEVDEAKAKEEFRGKEKEGEAVGDAQEGGEHGIGEGEFSSGPSSGDEEVEEKEEAGSEEGEEVCR